MVYRIQNGLPKDAERAFDFPESEMSLADIRALIETKVNDAFGVLNPPVEVVFDNVQEHRRRCRMSC